MKRFASVVVALGLATAGSTALATQANDQVNRQLPKPQPVKMTDAQMDNVAAGLIAIPITVVAIDVADVSNVANNLRLSVPVVAAANVALLGVANQAATQGVGVNQGNR
jgi:hypothetical protein